MRLFRFRGVGRQLQGLVGRSAGAEVHRFEETIYVTTGWASGWAVAAPEDATPAQIGALVEQALGESRRDPEPLVISRRSEKRDERHEKAWERFCRDVAGTSVIRYRPEIRIGVHAERAVLVRPILPGARPDLEAEIELSSGVSAEELGEAVARLLAETPPYWPTVRHATVATVAGDRLAVHPHRGMFLAGPVRVLDAGVDEPTLGREIAAALAAASVESDERENFYDALEAVGLDERDLEGGAHASIEETSRGAIRIEAWKRVGRGSEPAGTPEETIEDADMDAVARTALAQLRSIRTRHRRPGTETGVSWGYKTAWLAVRTEQSEDVVEALGLTGRRELTWKTGVGKSYDDGIFVTPATSGWTFAVGVGWFGREPDVAALSARLDAETQFFATHRVVDAHTWALARDGTVVRRVEYVGEQGTLEEAGTATDGERALSLGDLDVDSAIELVSEETVMNVAGAWSIDPRELGTIPTSATKGVYGKLPRG